MPFAAEGLEAAGDLLTRDEYKAHTMRLRGHMPGLALRGLQNRANRQSAHMAAGLAQFIANRYVPGVVDDGDLDKIERGLMEIFLELKYDIGQYYMFQDELERPGHFPCMGGLVANVSQKYPKIVEYLQSAHGQFRCVTQAKYDELHVYSWHTNADGTKVGWDGIGGVNRFVLDLGADTLRLPDLRGMSPEMVSATLGVGDVDGDRMRNFRSGLSSVPHGYNAYIAATNAFTVVHESTTGGQISTNGSAPTQYIILDPSRIVPTGDKFAPRRWGALACVYLGLPAS